MSKTLIIHYLPRKTNSNTKKILDEFKTHVKGNLQEIDIAQHPPDLLTPDILSAYLKRNYQGEALTANEKKTIQNIDKLTKQFREADIIVVAYPMYNFSLPGAVKAYFDAVMQKGETWDINGNGFYGLMQDKKALIITTSGGSYDGETSIHDYSTNLITTMFGFMDFDQVELVQAQGLNQSSVNQEELITQKKEAVKKIAQQWY